MNRLPDGTETKSDREYVDTWREFARPICEAANLELYGFDPGLALHTKERYPKSLDLPCWFVERINAALAGEPIEFEEIIEQEISPWESDPLGEWREFVGNKEDVIVALKQELKERYNERE